MNSPIVTSILVFFVFSSDVKTGPNKLQDTMNTFTNIRSTFVDFSKATETKEAKVMFGVTKYLSKAIGYK